MNQTYFRLKVRLHSKREIPIRVQKVCRSSGMMRHPPSSILVAQLKTTFKHFSTIVPLSSKDFSAAFLSDVYRLIAYSRL